MEENVVLSGKEISKKFGGNQVLKNISLEIYEGDFTVIMGSSGSGKSTLLYCLSGMDRVSLGTVCYRGRDVTKSTERELTRLRAEEYGFVFQGTHLAGNLTLYENILMGGFVSTKYSEKESRAYADQLVERMDLSEAKDRLPSEVSGGEAQRAAVARAVISKPDLLFADEPTGALNKANSEEVMNLFSSLNARGQTILLVTHDKNAALRGNRILYLEDGEIMGELALPLEQEAAVQKNASEYFFFISLSMLFRAMGTILGAALRAVKDTKTPLYISVIANGLNILLNYLLIYTAGWGVQGAAVASAVSYLVFGILMFAAYRRNVLLCWKWREFQIVPAKLKECVRVSLPVLGTGATSCLGYVVFARLVSGMGTTVFAAHSIAVTAETIFYIAGYGLRTATSTLVGNALGEGDGDKIRLVGRVSTMVTVSMMCLNGVLLYFLSAPLMSLLTNSEQVAELDAAMLRLVAFSEPFFGMMIVAEGIFYGLGKTRYPFVVETFSMWGIRILFTSLVVLVWKLDLTAVWYCMIADNVCKALLLMAGVSRKNKLLAKQGIIPYHSIDL